MMDGAEWAGVALMRMGSGEPPAVAETGDDVGSVANGTADAPQPIYDW